MQDPEASGSAPDDASIPAAPSREMPTSMLSTGWEDLEAMDHTLELHTLAGTLPADLCGHLFVAGSIATPGRPSFTGEGTIYRIDFEPDAPSLKQAVFRPPCFMMDRALQASEHGTMLDFHDLGLTRMSPLLGVRSVLSNSPIALRDRMIITTDAGRPWEFDPITLKLITPIGKIDEWVGTVPAPWLFPLILTTAHPVEDTNTGEFFTVNFANPGLGNPGFTHLIRWHERGPLEHFQLIDDDGNPVVIDQSIHQVRLTRNHIVFQDSAFVVEVRQLVVDAVQLAVPDLPLAGFLSDSQMRAQRPATVLYLIPRDQLRRSGGLSADPTPVRATRVEIPGESVHFFTQYDDDDHLEIIIPHTPTLDLSEWIHEGEVMLDGSRATEDMAGMQIPCALTPGFIAVHTIDTRTGRLLATRMTRNDETWGVALGAHAEGSQERPIEVLYFNTSGFAPELIPQRILRAYQDRVNTALLPLAAGKEPRLLAFEVATGDLVSWICPNGWGLMSPTFVPRHSGDGGPRDGYLVCLAHAADSVPKTPGSSGEELWIFDAADITKGPICRLGNRKLDFALTVHSAWLPELRPSPRDYKVSTTEDLDLENVTRRTFGQLAFWDIFSATLSSMLQHDTINQMLRDDVLPHFDRMTDPSDEPPTQP